MMKKYLLQLLLIGLLGVSLVACGDGGNENSSGDNTNIEDDDTDSDDDWENEGISTISGSWENEDGSTILQINDVGQVWYIYDGEVLFRGYFEQVELSEGDDGYEYHCRYDLYNDMDVLMSYCFYDEEIDFIIEKDEDGDTIDKYGYEGDFSLDENEYVGNWYIQGVSDSYCLIVKMNETWELRYPGADGELLCEGDCVEDAFGAYDFVIDADKNINLGSGELEENYLMFGVSSSSPYQLEPFGAYNFYSEEDSAPRISVNDYTGWWEFQGMISSLEIIDDSNWRVVYSDEEEATGTYEITENGIALTVETSNSLYFVEGEVMEFEVQADGSLYNQSIGETMVPMFAQPN